MINLSEDAIQEAIITRVVDEILDRNNDMIGMIKPLVEKRIDKIFADTAAVEVENIVKGAVNDALHREYFAVDSFGQKTGSTTIAKKLNHIVGEYWSERVNKSGAASTSSYDTITRAEYIMAQVCAKDFTDQMRSAAISVTASFKDGFRAQLAKHVDAMLDELFRVRSVQDQGKADKPW